MTESRLFGNMDYPADRLYYWGFSRETELIGCVYIYIKGFVIKESVHVIMEAGKSKICSVDPQIGDLADEGAGEIWRHSAEEFLPEQGGQSSIRAFNG